MNSSNINSEMVACYIRVSTQEQKLHGISLDAQRDKLTEYVTNNNFTIYKWYEDEGVSGRKLIKSRPALQEMLNDAQKGKFQRILFIKLDRFFRSVAEYHECMKMISPVIWTATEEKYDLSTASGRAFVNMKLTIAELEADQTGERIKIVNDYKVKNGQALTGSVSQGFAYTVEKIDGVKRVVKDKKTEQIVNDIIAEYLFCSGKRETIDCISKKYGDVISYRSLGKLLRDTKLYGYYKGNPDYCEPYIDKATFDKIQVLLNRNVRHPPSGRVYVFSGLIKCPCCGCKLAGATGATTKRGKNGKVYKNMKTTLSYRCSKNVVEKRCNFNRRPNQEKLETQLLSDFYEFIKCRTLMKDYYNEYQKKYIEHYIENNINKKELADLKKNTRKKLESYYYSLLPECRRRFWRFHIKEIQLEKDTLKPIPTFI